MNNLELSDRVYYEITNACNLNCVHCCNFSEKDKTYLDVEEILRFHKKLDKLGIKDSVVTGGEPTLHKDFEKLVNGLCKVGNVVITSNGIAWNSDRYIKFLKENRKAFVQISLDGFSEGTYDNIRGKGNFNKVMKNINDIVEAGYSHQLGLSMTIMRQNIIEVKDIIQFANKNKIRSVHFPTLISIGNGNDNWNRIVPPLNEQIEVEEYLLRELCKENKNTYISVNRINQILAWIHSGYNYDYCCTPTLKVDPFGEILPCAIASGEKNSVGSIFNINSIENCVDKLNEKWNEVIRVHKIHPERCSQCNDEDICPKHFCERCVLMHDESRKLNEECIDYKCKIYKHHFKRIKDIEVNINSL